MSWLYHTSTGIHKFLKYPTTVLLPAIPGITVSEFRLCGAIRVADDQKKLESAESSTRC
ncbi:hypothetical protein K432DRAFT_382048, partial [Lepidopterella palustris CBS 459.81]